MARKASPTDVHARGFGDIIGIVWISVAVLGRVSLFSYAPADISANSTHPNPTPRNWIGPVGAWLGYGAFFVFGAAAYLLPILLGCFGLSYLFQLMAYFHRRWVWAATLLLCCMGLLDLNTDRDALTRLRLAKQTAAATAATAATAASAAARPEATEFRAGFLERIAANLNAPGAGGWLGLLMNDYLFRRFFGYVGATIIFVTLYLISLLFLTNFQFGEWLRGWFKPPAAGAQKDLSDEEKALEQRARDLERQARKLQEQVAKAGLGPDLKPVPEPTVRDLSVPQAKAPFRSSVRPKNKAAEGDSDTIPGVDGEVIPATEITAATSEDILGRTGGREKTRPPKPDEPASVAPANKDTGDAGENLPVDAPPVAPPPPDPPPKPKAPSRKPKAIAVAATPLIGNYQLPTQELLNYPDAPIRPTESKEDLMANARLIQQTLAQFDIEVALGDITKGPTITRYELHPAPGVKLEKITALNNNIAAALKAERIHILAPVPGKSSVGVEVPNLVKTKVILRDLLESDEWRQTRARIPLALGKDVYGHPIVADLTEMPHLLIAGSTGSGKSVCINAIVASLLYRFPPDQLRFVMIDPKVVELQHYNTLPHLVVPVVNDPKKVILALRWVVNEMEKRYQIFARVGVRNIKSFNERPKGKPLPKSEPELPLKARKEKMDD